MPTMNFSVLQGDGTHSQASDNLPLPTTNASEEENHQSGQLQVQDAELSVSPVLVTENDSYTTKDDISLYLLQYGHLPDNFITKKEARSLGWSGGGLDEYSYGMCIGGDHFGNREGLLPEKPDRIYFECDVGTLHKSSRGAKRIIFTNDGLIYYTADHYESFSLLYGEE